MNTTTDERRLESKLSDFIGTTNYYYHPLYPWMKYTDGVKFFCENAGNGAYWFLDLIGTELKKHANNKHVFLTVTLLVYEDGTAHIFCRDGDNRLWSRRIDSTDCPSGQYNFYLQSNVFFLKSEY